VTPWIPNGDITAYLQEHQGVNRLNLVGIFTFGDLRRDAF
jgi:hypothetical protein